MSTKYQYQIKFAGQANCLIINSLISVMCLLHGFIANGGTGSDIVAVTCTNDKGEIRSFLGTVSRFLSEGTEGLMPAKSHSDRLLECMCGKSFWANQAAVSIDGVLHCSETCRTSWDKHYTLDDLPYSLVLKGDSDVEETDYYTQEEIERYQREEREGELRYRADILGLECA